MKSDISKRENIKLIITKFYDKLLVDEKMMPFFKEIVQKNQLEHHLEIIMDFWNDILFDTNVYQSNVMQKHLNKDAFVKFQKEHFAIWVSYFSETIDTYFEGNNAQIMKTRAASIATVMKLKMNVYEN